MSAKLNDNLFVALMLIIAASSIALGTNTFAGVIRGAGSGAGKNVDLKYFEKRFSPIKEFLGEGAGAGYYSDIKEGPAKTTRFLYARIILAPRVLESAPSGNAVIADISSGDSVCERADLKGYRVEKDFGSGLCLMRKSGN